MDHQQPSTAPSILAFPHAPHWGPCAHRKALGAHLTRCRKHRQLTGKDAARHLSTSPSRISRAETGIAMLRPEELMQLMDFYGERREAELCHLAVLAKEAAREDDRYGGGTLVERWARPLLELEPAAQVITVYEPQLVPGWLQTEEYAKIITRSGFPNATRAQVQQHVDARQRRMDIFRRPDDPVALLALMDDDVLRRPVGSPGVMYRQIQHLIQVMQELPHQVRLQMVPLSLGAIGAVGHPIVHLRFRSTLVQDFVYLEQSMTAQCYESREETERYQARLYQLSGLAPSADHTLVALEASLDVLDRRGR